jgi:selenoprotein W-related protein
LAASIRKAAGIDSVKLIPSSAGAFEIRLNGEILHSKLQTGDWPDFDALAEQIRAKI